MLSALISGLCLAGFHYAIHELPIASFGLALVISLMGSMTVKDSTSRGQLVSRLYAAAAAMGSVLSASLLARWPVAADAAFLVVIFLSVYVRSFGTRWLGVGMMGFMAYFMGDYLHPQLAQMGWVALAVVVASAVTHLVVTVLLKDDPEQDFRRALDSIDRRIDLILGELRLQVGDGHSVVTDRSTLRGEIAQLRKAVLMAEGFLPQGAEGSLAAEGQASELAVALFDLQLSVERAVGAAVVRLPASGVIDDVLHRHDASMDGSVGQARGAEDATDTSARLLIHVNGVRSRLGALLGPAPSRAFAEAPKVATPTPAGGGAPEGDGRSRIPKALQLPIQVTVASAIALGCGLLLSPVRWYWAVITAFVVFNNTQSRADTALRAMQRSAGTLAGLIAGTMAATALGGQTIASSVAIVLLFFVGFYFVQASYSVMIFCITVALALLYGLMGMFTPELLWLRLGETLVGALAGTGVAFFLFPIRASTAVGSALTAFLDALERLVDAARRRAGGSAECQGLLALSRDVDHAYTDLADAVRPMGGPWAAVTRFGAVREKLLLLTGCAHWGRSLARGLSGAPAPKSEVPTIDSAVQEIKGRIATARQRGSALFECGGDGCRDADERRRQLTISEGEGTAFSLEVISSLLSRAIG